MTKELEALIAEARAAANQKRSDLAYQSAQLFDRLANALEASLPVSPATHEELDPSSIRNIQSPPKEA